ncbi:MAG TPA: AMP-binding protein [Burkholderiales bacterium]|nr:AMP-binding protein [Burkholderiales bacterium]
MSDLPLARHELSATLAYCRGRAVSADEFLSDVVALASSLPETRYIINLCSDRYRFTVAFAAALMRRQTTLMPPNQTPDFLERVAHRYPDLHTLSDAATDALPPCGPRNVMPAVPADHVAAILFTSGSTGEPQPHPKSWGALVASAQSELERFATLVSPGLALVATVPPQHMYGLESTVMMALEGGLVLHAGRPFFPADICAELEALPRPRGLVTTPVHLRALLDGCTEVPPVDFLLCATAPLSPQLAARAETRFRVPLHEIYGCTEAGLIATRRTVATLEWQMFRQFRMRQDEKGTWLTGGHAATEFLLGDVIELGEAGRFELHGRTGDMVNIAGKRTSLANLNYHLNSIEGVRDGAFVIPADTQDAVTRLAAFVVAPGYSEEDILAALRKRIDVAFLPRPLHLVDALPRNNVGKLPRLAIDGLTERLTAKAG